jgi:hypothetical protein
LIFLLICKGSEIYFHSTSKKDLAKIKGLEYINLQSYYFAVSLGEEFDGWHYKLIAGILSIPVQT